MINTNVLHVLMNLLSKDQTPRQDLSPANVGSGSKAVKTGFIRLNTMTCACLQNQVYEVQIIAETSTSKGSVFH